MARRGATTELAALLASLDLSAYAAVRDAKRAEKQRRQRKTKHERRRPPEIVLKPAAAAAAPLPPACPLRTSDTFTTCDSRLYARARPSTIR